MTVDDGVLAVDQRAVAVENDEPHSDTSIRPPTAPSRGTLLEPTAGIVINKAGDRQIAQRMTGKDEQCFLRWGGAK